MKYKDLKDMDVKDKYKLYKEQQESEGRNRVGPLGGNQFDSRDLDEFNKEMRELERLIHSNKR